MNKLFIEFYLDENIPVLVGKILRARGGFSLTTDNAGNKGKRDADQLRFAVERELAIVTMNRVDFELLATEYFYSGKEHFGVFIFSDNSPQVIAQRLNDIVDTYSADEVKNQVVYLRRPHIC